MEISISKKSVKKFIACLMAMLIMFSCVPVGAFAVDGIISNNKVTDDNVTNGNVTDGNVSISGKCGDNVYYTVDEKGCLRIFGEGSMYNYNYTTSPFYGIHTIKKVVIEEGVTTIGDWTFDSCYEITSITIPNSMALIGEVALSGCYSLKSITVGENNQNFTSDSGVLFNKDKTKLIKYPEDSYRTEYTIPDGVTTIGDSAFRWSNNLNSITIPDSVTTIEFEAFANCYSLTNINIPSSVVTIADNAFWYCCGLTEITIPNGITRIGNYAFYNCCSLVNVTIPNSVISIDYQAFYYCDSLRNVYYGGPQEQWKDIYIESDNECLTEAKIHFNSSGNVTDDNVTDDNVTNENVTDGNISENDINVGETKEIYVNADEITYLRFVPEETGTYVFEASDLRWLKGYLFDSKKNEIESQRNDNDSINLKVKLEAGVVYYWGMEFPESGDYGYTYVSLKRVFDDIDDEDDDNKVTDGNVTDGNVTEEIKADYVIKTGETIKLDNARKQNFCFKFVPEISGAYRFYSSDSNGYTSAILYDANMNKIYETDEFDWYYTFDVSCEFTANNVYYWCVKYDYDMDMEEIEPIRFSVTLEKLCDHENTITVDEKEPTCTEDGYTYGEQCVDCKEWLWGHELLKKRHTDENSDRICEHCGETALNESGYCGGYEDDYIDEDAIGTVRYDLYADGTLEIYGEGYIESSAFSYDESIKHVIIKEGITGIGYRSFYYCTNIEDVSIAGTVKEISSRAFYNCYNIKKIDIPESVDNIGDEAFAYCEKIEKLDIPESVESIGYDAFAWCTNLGSISIQNSECYIYPSDSTIYYGTAIRGHEGSTAEEYAKEYGMLFIPFGVEITSIIYTPVRPFEFVDKISMSRIYDDETMGYYYGYDISLSVGDKIEIEFSNGVREKYIAKDDFWDVSFVSEDGKKLNGVRISTDKSEENVWNVGTHCATLSCMGEEVSVPVVIKESPIKKLSAEYKYTMYKDYDCKIGDYFSKDGFGAIYEEEYGYLMDKDVICKLEYTDGSEFIGTLSELRTKYNIGYSISLDSVGENKGDVYIGGLYGDFVINVEEYPEGVLPQSKCIANGTRVYKDEPLNLQLIEFADMGYEHEVTAISIPDSVQIDKDGKLTGTFESNDKFGMNLKFEVRWKDSPAHNVYSINLYSVDKDDVVEIPDNAELIEPNKEIVVEGSESDIKWFKFRAINSGFMVTSESFFAGSYGEEKKGSISFYTEEGLPLASSGRGAAWSFDGTRGKTYYVCVTGTDTFEIIANMWLPTWSSNDDSDEGETLSRELFKTNVEKTFKGDTNTKWNVYKYTYECDLEFSGGFSWEIFGLMRRLASPVNVHEETTLAEINKDLIYSINYKYDPNNAEECEKIGASTSQNTLKDELLEGEKEYRFDNVYYLMPETENLVINEERLIYVPLGYYLDGIHVVKCTEHKDKVTEKENVVEATCGKDGSYTEVVYCPVCDLELSREEKVIASSGHTYKADVTAPTCTDEGYTTYTCSACGDSYVGDKVKPIPHSYEVTENIAPTCIESGYITYTCSCGNSYVQVNGKPLDHDYQLVESKAPTCTADGYERYECKNGCGNISEVALVSGGHIWSEWKVVEATLLADGEKSRTCSSCNETEKEVLAKLEGEVSTDESTGISVEYTGDAYADKEVTVEAVEVVAEAADITKDYEKAVAWDIRTLVDGVEAQPDAPVLVSLPIPEGFDKNSVAVYHINSITGEKEKVEPVAVEGDTVKFLAESFSVYVLVDESTEIEVVTPSLFIRILDILLELLPKILDLVEKILAAVK